MDEDLVPQARAMAQASGTSIVVGLLVAKLEEMYPGTADDLVGRLETIARHLADTGNLNQELVDIVVTHAKGILATRNT